MRQPSSDESSFSLLLSLPSYHLSIALSYLEECNGATSALITNKYLHSYKLPLFRAPASLQVTNSSSKTGNNHRQLRKQRHVFRIFRSQDPTVLLARLNTRRLRKRICTYKKSPNLPYTCNLSTDQIAEQEWKDHCNYRNHQHHISHELLRFPSSSTPQSLFPMNEITLLASYPRCGNTLLRSLFEKLTCTITGADTRPDRTLSLALSTQHDMAGEGVTNAPVHPMNKAHPLLPSDLGVHLVKTHFPERRGYKIFDAQRIILLIRNPYDALESYFHMALTNTHTESLTKETFQDFFDTWEALVKDEIVTWRDFHLYWLSKIQKKSNKNTNEAAVPILVVRYEDLIRETREVMRRVIAFTLGKPLIKRMGQDGDDIGAFWENRLDLVFGRTKEGSLESLGSYRPRSVGDDLDKLEQLTVEKKPKVKIGKSLAKQRYSNDLLEHMNQVSGELLRTFGYDVLNQDFPQNIKSIPRRDRVLLNVPLSPMTTDETCDKIMEPRSVVVNKGRDVRDPQSKFGRYMTTYRKMFTNNDANPLPTIKKLSLNEQTTKSFNT